MALDRTNDVGVMRGIRKATDLAVRSSCSGSSMINAGLGYTAKTASHSMSATISPCTASTTTTAAELDAGFCIVEQVSRAEVGVDTGNRHRGRELGSGS
ncbi:hypothetical protein ACXX9E_29575 [Pseudomonas sp. GNP014]